MLLIHPPQVRNCEPPVALAHLAGALIAAGEPVTLVDGALEGFLWLTDQPCGNSADLQGKRVRRKKDCILTFSQNPDSFDKYKKKISDIRLLASTSKPVIDTGTKISPADYQDPQLSPLKSQDLFYSWTHPEENVYFPWFSHRLKPLLQEKDNLHVGVSMGFLSQALTGIAICGWIKKEFPHSRVILGGSLINSWLKGPSDTSALYKLADKIHHGQGERDIVQFTGREYKGPGIPSFGDLYNRRISKDYLSPGRILPYSAALGCSWKRCTFCSETWEQNRHCEKSSDDVVRHLSFLSQKYNPSLIHICDSEISPELIDRLIQQPPGPQWYGFSRFLSSMSSREYCVKLARSGCRMLCLGLESGDQKVLNSLQKGIRLESVSEILKNLKEAGILTYVYIMFGTPAENRDGALRTRDFIGEHSQYISFLNAAVFNMPIASREDDNLNSMEFYEGDLAIYKNFIHPEGWSRGEIRTFLQKDFKKITEIRDILKRTPPVFTSSHAPFMAEFLQKE